MLSRRSLVLAAVCLLALGARAYADPQPHITVFAAASLREAFEATGPVFTKKTGIAVTFDFGGSDALATQIAQGAPADVFASANDAQMKRLVDGGLLAGAPQTFARNKLVVITPAGHAAPASIADLAKPGIKVVLGAPSVPVGSYSRQAFKSLNGTAGYPADFAGAVEKNVVSQELDVKAVATKVALGEADAGVVYATDVTPAIASKVKTLSFPAGAAPEASYPIATLKAGDVKDGEAFVEFVLSGEGQAFLRARGFLAS
jgi:molybdate transport system substrate-binding protein